MQIRVKLFAILRDRAGVSELTLDLRDGATVAAAAKAVGERFPAVADFLPRVAHAVDQEYVPGDTVLRDGQELALIPPVSGG